MLNVGKLIIPIDRILVIRSNINYSKDFLDYNPISQINLVSDY